MVVWLSGALAVLIVSAFGVLICIGGSEGRDQKYQDRTQWPPLP